jgi:hypothetical protein
MSSGSAEIDQTSDSDESCALNLNTNRVISDGSMGCIVEIFYCRDDFAIPTQLKYGMEAWQQPADSLQGNGYVIKVLRGGSVGIKVWQEFP